jgi:hypothetical protein
MNPKMDEEAEAVAWAILQALHENVPEESRPKSWSDLKGDQNHRIRAAAVAAIECVRERDARSKPRPTISELEELLKDRPDDPEIQINPDGSIEVRKPLTLREKIGGEYGYPSMTYVPLMVASMKKGRIKSNDVDANNCPHPNCSCGGNVRWIVASNGLHSLRCDDCGAVA